MGAQGQGPGVPGIKLFDNFGPERAGGAHLGHFHKIIHADGPEKRKSGRKRIDIDACL